MNVAVKPSGMSRRKRSLLPLLVVLFLISYGMLTKLVLEQDRTIDSQRTLIHLLFKDNLHLSALKKAQGHNQAKASQGTSGSSVQSPSSKISVTQIPSTQISPTQVPSVKGPSTQASSEKGPLAQVPSGKTRDQNSAKTDRKSGKAQKRAPNRPPAELTDPSDMRRVSVAI
jgi:hypothetical protein